MPIPDRSIRICADRGGTFCDVHASYPDPENHAERKDIDVKLREPLPAARDLRLTERALLQSRRILIITEMHPPKASGGCLKL